MFLVSFRAGVPLPFGAGHRRGTVTVSGWGQNHRAQNLDHRGKQIQPYFLRGVGVAWSVHTQISLPEADIHRADLVSK